MCLLTTLALFGGLFTSLPGEWDSPFPGRTTPRFRRLGAGSDAADFLPTGFRERKRHHPRSIDERGISQERHSERVSALRRATGSQDEGSPDRFALAFANNADDLPRYFVRRVGENAGSDLQAVTWIRAQLGAAAGWLYTG